MISKENPWALMRPDSIRRVDSDIIHNLYWITDQKGNYGLYLESEIKFEEIETDIKLKGVSLIKRNTIDSGELFLILNRQNDWELFLTLCEDIISVCSTYQKNDKMVNAMETRLKRWQLFLMQNTEITIPFELQMGLFSELICLRDTIIPYNGVKNAIVAWVGPEKDKQDFSFSDFLLEVKSYKTTNGPSVTISSALQLYSEKKPIYLISYGITQSELGKSIADLATELEDICAKDSIETLRLFEIKLISYGFMPGIKFESLKKFSVDKIRLFEIDQNFPKLLPDQIPQGITSLKYIIDLQLCTNHERTLSTIFN